MLSGTCHHPFIQDRQQAHVPSSQMPGCHVHEMCMAVTARAWQHKSHTVTPKLAKRALSTSVKAGSYVLNGSRKPGRSSVISSAKASWYLGSQPH